MPSLTATDRHVVIDHREGHYLCFPDVCLTRSGRLLVAYNEFDQHVGQRRKLLLKSSEDLGESWSEPWVINATQSHCPRLTVLSDGQIVMSDDSGPLLYWSMDHGKTWASHPNQGIGHGLLDRITEIDHETLLTTGHGHRGTQSLSKIRQAPAEQMVYLSKTRGRSWQPLTAVNHDPNLVLCEGSITRLPDGRLLCLLRENTFVYEPMYKSFSSDDGRSWSEPTPTPLIGHRPTIGILRSGKLLVTYRDVGPNRGTAAWLGDVDELDDFAVHGLDATDGGTTFTGEGMRIATASGSDAPVRYALRPMTDPERAQAEIEAEVRVDAADAHGCGIRMGIWWRLFPDRVEPDPEFGRPEAACSPLPPIPLPPGEFHTIRATYDAGVCTLFINGEAEASCRIDPLDGLNRAIVFGTTGHEGEIGGDHVWRRVRLRVRESRYDRDYLWTWEHDQGRPDDYIRRRVLELKNDRFANPGDFGYSGWCQLPDESIFCAFHHGGGGEDGYEAGRSSRVLGVRFSEADFG